MSEHDPKTGPIDRLDPADAALAKLLDGYKAPALSADFADRVLAQTEDRAAPLPDIREARGTRWRRVRRLAIGAGAFGALATGAAATGLLDNLPIDLPSGEEVWATITGNPIPTRPEQTPDAVTREVGSADKETPVTIEGPIDTPEELEAAFDQIDRVRDERLENRRGRVDNRIDQAIERRRERGLPVPDAEQEARLKQRLEEARTRRDERVDERIGTRRDELRERAEDGEELSPREILREERGAAGGERLRERIEELRSLPPEERRQRLREFRERRQQMRENRLGTSPSEPSTQPADANGEGEESQPEPLPIPPEQ
ncbi:hypothetical protein [Erythrobacter sp. YT30]|uniref:hypothetical protein n=1 Tax=Erythrobacter sp. YT30 TaxID=1735012 RepID=UPI00076C68C2|nr:hypothetical protein [Erythrobacter sp. YT30]KWV92642.1 hypothetical protein AUC45_00210 [Erythrobacter sp. YT30]